MFVTRLSVAACAVSVGHACFASTGAGSRRISHLSDGGVLGETREAGQCRQPSGDMNYYGGSVFSNVKVVSVMWGTRMSAPTTCRPIPGFFGRDREQHLCRPDGEYNTKGRRRSTATRGTKQKIGRGTYLGQVQITPKNQSRPP